MYRFLFLLSVFAISEALYFHMQENERRCFIEEIPEDTLVKVNYTVEMRDPNTDTFNKYPNIGMHVEVKNPEDKLVLSKLYTFTGIVVFSSQMPGEHSICLYSNSTKWFANAELRVHLDLLVGEHAQDYGAIAAKEKLSELQLKIRQLLDQVDQISKEQNYQRFREERFRETSESTSQRVLWWAIVQTAILLATGFWQMRHLKGFFEAKKLV